MYLLQGSNQAFELLTQNIFQISAYNVSQAFPLQKAIQGSPMLIDLFYIDNNQHYKTLSL